MLDEFVMFIMKKNKNTLHKYFISKLFHFLVNLFYNEFFKHKNIFDHKILLNFQTVTILWKFII